MNISLSLKKLQTRNKMQKIKIFILFILLILLALLAILSAEPMHELSGWIITAAVLPFFVYRKKHSLFLRLLFLLTVAFVSLRYITFRSIYTLNFENNIALCFGLFLFVAELYSVLVHFIGIAVNIYPMKRPQAKLPQKLPSVDIFIPTYNEDEDIAVITATACKNLDYPAELLNIYILNDGGRLSILNDSQKGAKAYQRHLSLKQKADKLGIHYLTRADGEKAKAGMINEALMGRAFSEVTKNKDGIFVGGKPQKTNGELVLILDCDHIPTTDFLKESVGYFTQNDKLFMAQTPHFMINQEPIRKNLDYNKTIPAEGFLFYHFVQQSLDRWNASFFCGSAAILRRSLLEANNGLEGDTITEDCETALRMHQKGYKSIFIDKPMIAGLETENFESFLGQRSRWCKGMLQILLLKNPLFTKGLSFMQRLSYLNSCLFWLFPLFRYIFILAPLIFLYFGINIYNMTFLQVINYAGPHLVCSTLVMYYLYPQARGFLYAEILETVQMICLTPAVISVFLHPKKPTFNTTPKGLSEDSDYTSIRILPFLVLFVLIIGGFIRAAYMYFHYPLLSDAVLLTSFWNLFNFIVIIACLGIMWEKKKEHKDFSIPIKNDEIIKINNREALLKRLSVSEMEFDVPQDVSLTVNQTYEVFTPNGSKTKIKIDEQHNQRISASMTDHLSADNIRFVFGDSSRWQSVYTTYNNQINKIPVGLYLVKSSLINCLSIAKNYFKFLIVFAIFCFPQTADAKDINIPLSQIKGENYIYFNNLSESSTLTFFVSPRWKVSQAKLLLHYSYPKTFNEKNISFQLSVRGKQLSWQNKNSPLEVSIPVDYLKKGENELLISFNSDIASDGCTLNNEKIEVDMKKSYLYFEYDIPALQQRQDIAFSDLFNAYDLDKAKLNIIYDVLNLKTLKEALILSSKSAIEATYRPFEISLSTAVKEGTDNIALAPNLCHFPSLKNTLCLNSSQISGDPVFKQNILRQEHTYRFSELGFKDKMFKYDRDQKSFSFLLPSDSYLSPNKYITLNLDLIFGNQIKPNAKLKVLLNEKDIAEAVLKNKYAQKIRKYTIKFRASLLRKGLNTITFMSDMSTGDVDKNCSSAGDRGIFITLFNNSTIEIPKLGYLVELPNLQFLFNDGYPFNEQNDIFISELNQDSAEAVIKAGTYMAQKRGTLPLSTDFYLGKPDYKGHNLIVFETDPTLADDILIISEQWIENTDNLKLTYKAKSFANMNKAMDALWNKKLFENIDKDTIEFNFIKQTVKTYNLSTHKEVSGNIGIQKQISFLSNNNIFLFYVLLALALTVTAAWLLVILKGSENEK